MFYVLSRIFAMLASPVFYMLSLLLVAVYASSRKVRIWCVGMCLILFVFATNHRLYGYAERAWCRGCIVDIDTTKHYDYAIIPGGVTGYDALRGRVEYGEASDRIVDCALLMNMGVIDKMIVTGDGASNMSGDSTFFRKHMERTYGISGERILIEPRAKNTIENFTLTMEQFGEQLDGKRILVINSARYMRRTMLCCRMTGLECDYYTVDINTSKPINWEEWVPDLGTLDHWMKLAHEWIGYVAYQFY